MKIKQLILTVSIFITMVSSVIANETIHLTSGEWVPFLSENLKHYGYISRVVKEAFELEGVTVEFGFFPWQRSFDYALHGEWNGSVAWLNSPERAEQFYFSDPIMESVVVFFHMKSFPFEWNSIEDLKGILIGATQGNEYERDFRLAEESGVITVERVSKSELNFYKLLSGRIKLFPQNLDVGFNMLRKMFPPEKVSLFTYHRKPLHTSHLHLILSKKVERNKRMLQLFNRGLKRLTESGEVKQYKEESLRGGYIKLK